MASGFSDQGFQSAFESSKADRVSRMKCRGCSSTISTNGRGLAWGVREKDMYVE